jgi:hypothetical protein
LLTKFPSFIGKDYNGIVEIMVKIEVKKGVVCRESK